MTIESLQQLSLDDWLLYGLGFLAQSLFGARILVQWIQSEKAGRVVSPTWFWIFSLGGSSLFLIYGILRQDVIILVGQTISFYIYIRNLQLKKFWYQLPAVSRIIITVLTLVIFLWTWYYSPSAFHGILQQLNFADSFIMIGGLGQLLLNFRYLYQWYQSERAQESVLPLGFWLISAAASVMVVIYGFYRHDPVLLVAQGMGFVVYLRNIYLSINRFSSSRLQ
mgnify:FL=1